MIATRIGDGDVCQINLEDGDGRAKTITLRISELPALIEGLAAVAACSEADNRPKPGTAVPGAHLPVKRWHTGFSNTNREPLLILTTMGDVTLTYQVPAASATEVGEALIKEGERAAAALKRQPN